MKLTIVGHWGAYPEVNEATSGYLIQHNNKNILIDCGCGVISRLQNYIKIEDLDAVVLSHYHADHIGDIYPMQYAIMSLRHIGRRKKNLKIYALDNDDKFQTLNYGSSCSAYPIKSDSSTEIEGLKFTFLETVHPVPCLAMRIDGNNSIISYTSDSEWSENLISIAKDADIFLCECNLYNNQKGRITGHLTSGEAGMIASRSKTKHLVLTHLPHDRNHHILVEEAQANFKGRITLAAAGLTFDL